MKDLETPFRASEPVDQQTLHRHKSKLVLPDDHSETLVSFIMLSDSSAGISVRSRAGPVE